MQQMQLLGNEIVAPPVSPLNSSDDILMRKETLLNTGYLSHWGLFEAGKEFAQNHIFALQHLGAKGNHYYSDGCAVWEDKGPGFGLEMLLMGNGQQKEIENAPGENSEGMKVALMVACREGCRAEIQLPGKTVRGQIEKGSLGDDELVLYIFENKLSRGVRYIMEMPKDVYESVNKQFGFLENPKLFSDNNIVGSEGNLYINGVKIEGSYNFLYSYNLVGKGLSNRDRNAVDRDKIVKRIWLDILYQVKDEAILENILRSYEEEYDEFFDIPGVPSDAKKRFKKQVKKLWGSKPCLAVGDTQANNLAKYHGFTVLPRPTFDMTIMLKEVGVPDANKLPVKSVAGKRVNLRDLTPEEKKNLKEAKEKVLGYLPELYPIRIYENLVGSHGEKANGIFEESKKAIYLDRSRLENLSTCFSTLLHEAVHQKTGASDMTSLFMEGLQEAAFTLAFDDSKADCE